MGYEFQALVASYVSLLVAGMSAGWIFLQLKQSAKQGDASLILQSFVDYEKLFDDLVHVRRLYDKNRQNLDRISVEAFDETNFRWVSEYEITDMEWKSARRVKQYFKARYQLVRGKIFSDKAIAATIDRGGIELLDHLAHLDADRFYRIRRDDHLNGRLLVSPRQYKKDMEWYAEIRTFVAEHGEVRGQ